MTGKSNLTPFEVAYFVENYMRTKHEDAVEKGPTKHLVMDNWIGFEEWLVDPSRRDFPGVDTHERRNPPKNFNKHITEIKHVLHSKYEGILHDQYWSNKRKR